MTYLWAFLVGGLICAAGQLLIDVAHIPPAHTMVVMVCAGAVLTGLGLYEPLLRFAGAGASVPLTNFGFVLTKGALSGLAKGGWVGMLSGILELSGTVLAAAVLFGFAAALVFRPRS
ncbi:MAG: SpoVA/SpoVAEb family sporulation membrane protein [Limnochordaceae bacterium]|nr:SpoVA/SpoVAEb family sporulation membrane protein [Limnochordaceae bacterium]